VLAPDLGCVNFAANFRAGSTHRGRVTAHSKIMWSAYFAGFGTKNALPGKWDDCTLTTGQTPIGLGITYE